MEKIYKTRTDYKTCLNNTNNILYIICLDKIWTEDFIDIIRRNFDNFKVVVFVYVYFENNDELYPENDLWKACCVSKHYEIIHNKLLEIKEKKKSIKLSVINNMIENDNIQTLNLSFTLKHYLHNINDKCFVKSEPQEEYKTIYENFEKVKFDSIKFKDITKYIIKKTNSKFK